MVEHGGYDVLATDENRPRAVRLALENGAIFTGRGFGAETSAGGEVVFNTAMGGYQEALTDPSYTGQILVMTATEIGNYGVAHEDVESSGVAVAGFVVRDQSRIRSNHRASSHLHHWLAEAGIPGIEDLDTRALVRILRSEGAMRGVIESDASISDTELVNRARGLEAMSGRNLAAEVGAATPGTFTQNLGDWPGLVGIRSDETRPFVVMALDCGAKRNIYRHLVERGCEVRFMPHDTPAADLKQAFEGGRFMASSSPTAPVTRRPSRRRSRLSGKSRVKFQPSGSVWGINCWPSPSGRKPGN